MTEDPVALGMTYEEVEYAALQWARTRDRKYLLLTAEDAARVRDEASEGSES